MVKSSKNRENVVCMASKNKQTSHVHSRLLKSKKSALEYIDKLPTLNIAKCARIL